MERALVFVALAGCYTPANEDVCTVGCVDDTQCPSGQVCGGNGVCRLAAAPDCTSLGNPLGPVGWWPFEEGQGSLTADASGHGDDGVLQGGAMWTTGRSGSAIEFDGNTGMVLVGSSPELSDLGAFTVTAWIAPKNLAPSLNGGAQRIVSKEPSVMLAGPGHWFLVMDDMHSGAIQFRKGFMATELIRSSSAGLVTAGAWHHVAASWDGGNLANGVVLYVDGVASPGFAASQNGSGPAGSDASYTVQTGNEPTMQRGFAGNIDDVRIYDRVLSAAEIAALVTQ